MGHSAKAGIAYPTSATSLESPCATRQTAHNPPNHSGDVVRRLLIGTIAVGIAAGAAAPALAGPPPIPVTVTGHPNGGICVQVSSLDPQCLDLGKPTATGR